MRKNWHATRERNGNKNISLRVDSGSGGLKWRRMDVHLSDSSHAEMLTTLTHVKAAVDVEDLAGDVGGFVAREEDDGGSDVGFGAEAR